MPLVIILLDSPGFHRQIYLRSKRHAVSVLDILLHVTNWERATKLTFKCFGHSALLTGKKSQNANIKYLHNALWFKITTIFRNTEVSHLLSSTKFRGTVRQKKLTQ